MDFLFYFNFLKKKRCKIASTVSFIATRGQSLQQVLPTSHSHSQSGQRSAPQQLTRTTRWLVSCLARSSALSGPRWVRLSLETLLYLSAKVKPPCPRTAEERKGKEKNAKRISSIPMQVRGRACERDLTSQVSQPPPPLFLRLAVLCLR